MDDHASFGIQSDKQLLKNFAAIFFMLNFRVGAHFAQNKGGWGIFWRYTYVDVPYTVFFDNSQSNDFAGENNMRKTHFNKKSDTT